MVLWSYSPPHRFGLIVSFVLLVRTVDGVGARTVPLGLHMIRNMMIATIVQRPNVLDIGRTDRLEVVKFSRCSTS